jgi:RimJ/RimL family protein N-acetyltransferase
MIETKRLILRRFEKEDANDLYEYLKEKSVCTYEPYDPFTYEEAVASAVSRRDNPAFIAVVLKDEQKVIGNLYVGNEGPDDVRTKNIGYVFNPVYQHFGYATEATQAILFDLFMNQHIHRIVAYCNQENSASYKLLERLGFRREASYMKNMYFKVDEHQEPIWFNTYQYAMLAEEFKTNIAKDGI